MDGAWKESKKIRGLGIVIRNHLNLFVVARALVFEYVSSPLLIEALAVWERLLLTIQRGHQDIIIESDAFQIISALCNGLLNGSLLSNIVEDSKAFFSTITGATATDTRRQNNEATHRLACYALSSSTNCLWFEEPPDIIIDVIMFDCNVQTLLCCVLALFVVLASAYPFVPNFLSMN